jgi:hypothetical protein
LLPSGFVSGCTGFVQHAVKTTQPDVLHGMSDRINTRKSMHIFHCLAAQLQLQLFASYPNTAACTGFVQHVVESGCSLQGHSDQQDI